MENIKKVIPEGFWMRGIPCGISRKKNKKDLALIFSDIPATVAATFTRNRLKSVPVLLTIKNVRNGRAQLIIANSGCANACTGRKGLRDAEEIIKLGAKTFKTKKQDVLVASTGMIGNFLPLEKIRKGIKKTLHIPLGRDKYALLSTAEAIMTTDTFPKYTFQQFFIGKERVNILGIAKGAGMICPNLATMLCFLLTDISISKRLLKKSLQEAVNQSFNIITVDGEMSTNDCVFVLANGKAKNKTIQQEDSSFKNFQSKLNLATLKLAKMIVRDGEGATKLVKIRVQGGRTFYQADSIGRKVAHSPLFKTAVFGNNPNWGRIMAACGSSKERIDPNKIDIYFDNLSVVKNGIGTKISELAIKRVFSKKEFKITIDLKLGDKQTKIYTCDFSPDYVTINSS